MTRRIVGSLGAALRTSPGPDGAIVAHAHLGDVIEGEIVTGEAICNNDSYLRLVVYAWMGGMLSEDEHAALYGQLPRAVKRKHVRANSRTKES